MCKRNLFLVVLCTSKQQQQNSSGPYRLLNDVNTIFIKSKLSQNVWKICTSHYSVACWTTFSSNNLTTTFSCIVAEGLWPPPLYKIAWVNWIWFHFLMHSSINNSISLSLRSALWLDCCSTLILSFYSHSVVNFFLFWDHHPVAWPTFGQSLAVRFPIWL